jgi:hypothetical protein
MSKKDKSKPASNVEAFPQQPLQISLGDLQVAVEIIDVVTKRGAFNGDELQSVGALRNKFVAFVQANTPKDKNQPAPAAAKSDEGAKTDDPQPPAAV